MNFDGLLPATPERIREALDDEHGQMLIFLLADPREYVYFLGEDDAVPCYASALTIGRHFLLDAEVTDVELRGTAVFPQEIVPDRAQARVDEDGRAFVKIRIPLDTFPVQITSRSAAAA